MPVVAAFFLFFSHYLSESHQLKANFAGSTGECVPRVATTLNEDQVSMSAMLGKQV